MKEVIEVLNGVKKGVDYEKEEHLVTDGILSSFDIIMLISALKEKFDVEITVMDIVPENFESAKTIKEFIDSLE